ncbi:unnamed protein product [Pleuronectes platessa]|uniref:Uncharacterized protein n=1 Tax=Pleuronectes platessa TaxID=8262 RepID=A0A9N7ZCR9_PLEPL|nr:unnamed protein product [Pleuronectes platessa]
MERRWLGLGDKLAGSWLARLDWEDKSGSEVWLENIQIDKHMAAGRESQLLVRPGRGVTEFHRSLTRAGSGLLLRLVPFGFHQRAESSQAQDVLIIHHTDSAGPRELTTSPAGGAKLPRTKSGAVTWHSTAEEQLQGAMIETSNQPASPPPFLLRPTPLVRPSHPFLTLLNLTTTGTRVVAQRAIERERGIE